MPEAKQLLVDALEEAFRKPSWHGPNLRGSLRGVTAEQAAWRPAPGRHNIWELALHAAYWKYVARRRLTGEKRGSFVVRGSNFFPRPEGDATESAFRRDLEILEAEHMMLREATEGLPASAFTDSHRVRLIRGIAAHDVYHAGQIRLLRRLCPV